MPSPANDAAPPDRRTRDRVLLIVIFTVFLDLVGFGIVIPLLPFYVTGMHASAIVVGFILTSFSAAQILSTPLLGKLSDRYGRRPIILISLVGNAVSMIVFALATHLSLLWLLFASRLVAGATAGNLSACQAAIADVTPREARAAAMGRLGAGIGLGLVIGPLVGGQLSDIAPWAPPVAGAAMALLDVILTAALMPETRRERAEAADPRATGAGPPAPAPSILAVLSERRMASVLLLYFLTFLTITNLQVALGLLVKERLAWGPKEFGQCFGLFGVLGLVIQGLLIGRLARAVGEISLVIAGAALNVAGMLCIGLAYTRAPLLAGLVLLGVGVAVTNPSLSSLASRFARDEQQGAVLGFAQSAGTLARAIGPSWSGFLFAKVSSTAPFLSGALAALASLLIGLSMRGLAGAGRPDPAPGPGA
ncbi:MAG: MFS transporter [Polyangiaceae bacterium]|nr:MFS transporter [Polyangiaceae bacterium]